MKCFICNAPVVRISSEPYQNRIIHIQKCSNCEILFNNDMDDTISPDYVDIDISDEHIWLQSEHKHAAFNQFLDRISGIKDINQYLLIDYGCGTGGFIKMLADEKIHGNFAEIIGVEASEKQVNYATNAVKNKIILSNTFPVKEINEMPYEGVIITMWDVLEHIRNPVTFLKEFSKIEKKSVYLFFSVPAAKPMKQKYRLNRFIGGTFSFMPWEHVTYYSPKSLPYLSELIHAKLQIVYPVVCYRRKISFFELIRRIYFIITSFHINIHPQLGVVMKIK